MKTVLKNIFYGIVIGSSMLIPGVSGGTTAIILGIYDKLIKSVSDIFGNFRKNIVFLLEVAVGGVTGVLLFSRGLLWLSEQFYFPVIYFFMGAIFGSIPLMIKKSEIRMSNIYNVIFAFVGVVMAISVKFIPENIFDNSLIMLFLCGMIIAVALILPGISTSHILLVFGIYETALKAVSELDWLYIAVLGSGIILGIILFTKILGKLMFQFPSQTFMAITGFVMASVYDIFRGFPSVAELPVCVILFILAFSGVYFLSRKIPSES